MSKIVFVRASERQEYRQCVPEEQHSRTNGVAWVPCGAAGEGFAGPGSLPSTRSELHDPHERAPSAARNHATRQACSCHPLGRRVPRVSYGIPGGGTRRIVACSKAYANSISRGSLHAIPAKLTPNGRGFGAKPSGIGGSGSVSAKANGTITVG